MNSFSTIYMTNERQNKEKYFDKKSLTLIQVLKAKDFLSLDYVT